MTHDHTPDDDRRGHEPPDLVGLLGGELTREETLDAAQHLRGCAACSAELVEVIVAHAALRSSARVTHLLAEGPRSGEGASTRSGPAGAVGPGSGATGGDIADAGGADALPPLPPLTGAEPGGRAPGRTASVARRRRTWRVVSGAAAAVVVVAGVTLGVAASRHGPGSPGPGPVATAALRPIAAPPSASGSVAVYASGPTRSLSVDARGLPAPSSQSFYEVWLLDPATQKMLPMGVLGPSGRGEYSVSSTIMGGYSAVDVSLQANDGNPAHSETSVLRAYLQA
jgi:hypothetical protein